MRKVGFIIGMFAIALMLVAIYFVLSSENALVTHPKGIIAYEQLKLIITNVILILIIIVPTFILVLVVAWKYRTDNPKTGYDPDRTYGLFRETLLWAIPSIIVVVMAPITWYATHKLDPFRPLKSDVPPLKIQVVALDWKWLFIYPEQGIATVNFFQFPEKTPIHFALSADGSPMNSFWVPQLSGQIYCMTGMVTSLHVMADGPGEYVGRAAEINGEGYADMRCVAKSTSQSDFETWIEKVKQSSPPLTDEIYNELVARSINNPIASYSNVEPDLFDKIMRKYLQPKI